MKSNQTENKPLFELLASYFSPVMPDRDNGTVAMSAINPDDGSLCVMISFDNPGICRSRPLFIGAVVAAASAIWSQTYHALYGEEALPFFNDEMFMKFAEAEYENR